MTTIHSVEREGSCKEGRKKNNRGQFTNSVHLIPGTNLFICFWLQYSLNVPQCSIRYLLSLLRNAQYGMAKAVVQKEQHKKIIELSRKKTRNELQKRSANEHWAKPTTASAYTVAVCSHLQTQWHQIKWKIIITTKMRRKKNWIWIKKKKRDVEMKWNKTEQLHVPCWRWHVRLCVVPAKWRTMLTLVWTMESNLSSHIFASKLNIIGIALRWLRT